MKKNLSLLKSNNSGFTFVELLVVIVIMAVLIAASANYLFSTGGAKSRDVERKNDIKQVASMLEEFVSKFGSPPNANLPVDKNTRLKRSLGADRSKCKIADGTDAYDKLIECLEITGAIGGDGVEKLKEDPKEGAQNDKSKSFDYRYKADQNMWKLCALLEDQKDPDINDDGDGDNDSITEGSGMYCVATYNRDLKDLTITP